MRNTNLNLKSLATISTWLQQLHYNLLRFLPYISESEALTQLQRILFVFAKAYPSIRYVQGMNDVCGTLGISSILSTQIHYSDILGTLLYVFGTDDNEVSDHFTKSRRFYLQSLT